MSKEEKQKCKESFKNEFDLWHLWWSLIGLAVAGILCWLLWDQKRDLYLVLMLLLVAVEVFIILYLGHRLIYRTFETIEAIKKKLLPIDDNALTKAIEYGISIDTLIMSFQNHFQHEYSEFRDYYTGMVNVAIIIGLCTSSFFLMLISKQTHSSDLLMMAPKAFLVTGSSLVYALMLWRLSLKHLDPKIEAIRAEGMKDTINKFGGAGIKKAKKQCEEETAKKEQEKAKENYKLMGEMIKSEILGDLKKSLDATAAAFVIVAEKSNSLADSLKKIDTMGGNTEKLLDSINNAITISEKLEEQRKANLVAFQKIEKEFFDRFRYATGSYVTFWKTQSTSIANTLAGKVAVEIKQNIENDRAALVSRASQEVAKAVTAAWDKNLNDAKAIYTELAENMEKTKNSLKNLTPEFDHAAKSWPVSVAKIICNMTAVGKSLSGLRDEAAPLASRNADGAQVGALPEIAVSLNAMRTGIEALNNKDTIQRLLDHLKAYDASLVNVNNAMAGAAQNWPGQTAIIGGSLDKVTNSLNAMAQAPTSEIVDKLNELARKIVALADERNRLLKSLTTLRGMIGRS